MRLFIIVAVLATACSSATTATTTVQPAPPTPVAPSRATSEPPPTQVAPSSMAPTVSAAPTTTVPVTEDRLGWYAASITGRLTEDFIDGLIDLDGVTDVSVVWVGNAPVTEIRAAGGSVIARAAKGLVFPMDLHAINPDSHAGFAPPDVIAALRSLRANDIALGHRSAAFRKVGVGATFSLDDGTVLTVRAVLDDQWVGAAEAVTTAQDPAPLGADRPRYAIFRYEGSAADLAPALQIFSELPVKIRAEADVPILRHADAVQPQIVIKQRFGEFSYRPAAGRGIVIDPDWLETHIVTKEIDLLGEVRCHRDFLDMLEKVMALLAQAGPADVVDPAAFLGCFNARTVTGRRDLSRHAWGVAADINFTNAVDGPGSPTAPDLIAVMELFGITSGHDWTIPDPGHFEWVGADFEH